MEWSCIKTERKYVLFLKTLDLVSIIGKKMSISLLEDPLQQQAHFRVITRGDNRIPLHFSRIAVTHKKIIIIYDIPQNGYSPGQEIWIRYFTN